MAAKWRRMPQLAMPPVWLLIHSLLDTHNRTGTIATQRCSMKVVSLVR
jgi:hypothetical protein